MSTRHTMRVHGQEVSDKSDKYYGGYEIVTKVAHLISYRKLSLGGR